jgi:hypothetical protein
MNERFNEIIFNEEQFNISEILKKIGSSNEIIDSLNILFNQVNERLNLSEDSIKKINFGSLFKQELDQITIKINENIEYLLKLIKKSTKKVDKSIRSDLNDFREDLNKKLSKVQKLLGDIIKKTPEMPEEIGIFKEYREEFKENIKNLLDIIKVILRI